MIVNDGDKFFVRDAGRGESNTEPEHARKNKRHPQSALINVWRTSGIDAKHQRSKHFSSITAPEKKSSWTLAARAPSSDKTRVWREHYLRRERERNKTDSLTEVDQM